MNTPTPPSQDGPQIPESNPKKADKDIKWYDKRLMIPSLVIAPLLFVLIFALAMRHKPPEGFVFERAPVLTGLYKCCEPGGRSSASWVGDVQVSCRGFGYYAFGTNRNDCGLKEQLNGKPVEVTRVHLPSSGDRFPLAVHITSQGHTYYTVEDKRIRERWLSETSGDAQVLALWGVLIFHFALFLYLNYFHKPTTNKGDQ